MRDRVRRLVGSAVAAGTVAGGVMVVIGMEPRLILVVCVVLLVTTAGWLVVQLGLAASPIVWYTFGTEAETLARPDRRVQVLRARLREPSRRSRNRPTQDADGSESSGDIVDSLMRIIDDHLLAAYGVDRTTDRSAATSVLGPELSRFVTDPSAQRSMTQRRTLAHTVALIEQL